MQYELYDNYWSNLSLVIQQSSPATHCPNAQERLQVS